MNLHVRHLRDAIEARFGALIDMSDVSDTQQAQRDAHLYTRGLAALGVVRTFGLTDQAAAQTIVDGSGDQGIDAILVVGTTIGLVQSKWHSNGTSSFAQGDVMKLIRGLKLLTNEEWAKFNTRFQRHVPDLEAALADPSVRLELVFVTSGSAEFGDDVQSTVDEMLAEMNDPQQFVTVTRLGLGELHRMIAAGTQGARVDLEVTLEHWGHVDAPYQAYYGLVDAGAVARWYDQHRDELFAQNLRRSLGATAVNDSIIETLKTNHDNFWYFNNGITALCESVRKTAKGGATRNYGEFVLEGVSIVNGAQTCASIATAVAADPDAAHARIWARFISLEQCPEGFATDVTRATNTQNTVEARDFVALDEEQNRLRTEMLLSLQKTYSIQRGEAIPPEASGCTVSDATVALACLQQDPTHAVLAKSAVGRLWDNITRPPYRILFNSGVTAHRLWRAVTVMRAVDSALEVARRTLEGRAKAVAVQGNRIVLHLVFRELALDEIDDPDSDWDAQVARVPELTSEMLQSLTEQVESAFSQNYITSLFKNASRCRVLVSSVLASRSAP
jgi:hypothetical protein